MPTRSASATAKTDVEQLAARVGLDGLMGLPGALPPAWADRLARDFEALFAEARGYEGGTVNRGPNRFYFAVHPEYLGGFVELVTHPLVAGLAEHMLGPDYEIAEVAFDVPLPGAVHQPWHRDFVMPDETRERGTLSSLAFNASTVDVTPDMGPFEFVPGTHLDPDGAFEHGMFPPKESWGRYEQRSRVRCPRRGDVSARTGLAIHRGTPNRSPIARPVLVVGAVAPHVDTSDAHRIEVTAKWHAGLPEKLRRRLRCEIVERIEPIIQRHDIEGLMM